MKKRVLKVRAKKKGAKKTVEIKDTRTKRVAEIQLSSVDSSFKFMKLPPAIEWVAIGNPVAVGMIHAESAIGWGHNNKFQDTYRAVLGYQGSEPLEVPGEFLSFIVDSGMMDISVLPSVLSLSKSKYYRQIKQDLLDPSVADRLSTFLKIQEKGLEAFEGDSEAFNDWLTTKIATLGNRTPEELMQTESGRITVLKAIGRIEHGIYG